MLTSPRLGWGGSKFNSLNYIFAMCGMSNVFQSQSSGYINKESLPPLPVGDVSPSSANKEVERQMHSTVRREEPTITMMMKFKLKLPSTRVYMNR